MSACYKVGQGNATLGRSPKSEEQAQHAASSEAGSALLAVQCSNMLPEVLPDIVHALHRRKDGQDLQQLAIFWLVDEGADGQGIVGLEDVGVGGIVHDDHLGQVTPQAQQVLHIIALVWAAGLPKEPPSDHASHVQQIQQRVCAPSNHSLRFCRRTAQSWLELQAYVVAFDGIGVNLIGDCITPMLE